MKERSTRRKWVDPDDAPEWPDEVWDRAEIAIGGKVVRPSSGTLTRRGRPPLGEAPKRQVTLRLAPHVLDHFKAGGAGWQTRIGEVLERHVAGTSMEQDRSSTLAETRREYMVDDLTNRGPQDRSRVNVNEPWEVRYWCGQFGCTEEQLRQAVGKVGVMRDNVERELRGR